MPFFKSPDNALHFLESNEHADLLPKGSVQITDAEADKLHPPSTNYTAQRAAEYPPVTVYLDAVVKGDAAALEKYIADCNAVKAKYPKPQS